MSTNIQGDLETLQLLLFKSTSSNAVTLADSAVSMKAITMPEDFAGKHWHNWHWSIDF
jgi:hypothetical protein